MDVFFEGPTPEIYHRFACFIMFISCFIPPIKVCNSMTPVIFTGNSMKLCLEQHAPVANSAMLTLKALVIQSVRAYTKSTKLPRPFAQLHPNKPVTVPCSQHELWIAFFKGLKRLKWSIPSMTCISFGPGLGAHQHFFEDLPGRNLCMK